MDLCELFDRIRALMEQVSETQGLDLECVEMGDRLMTIKDWADLNIDALREMNENDALIGFVVGE